MLTLTADAGADLFLDPAGLPEHLMPKGLSRRYRGFRLSAFVSPVFVSDFDSGVLIATLIR